MPLGMDLVMMSDKKENLLMYGNLVFHVFEHGSNNNV